MMVDIKVREVNTLWNFMTGDIKMRRKWDFLDFMMVDIEVREDDTLWNFMTGDIKRWDFLDFMMVDIKIREDESFSEGLPTLPVFMEFRIIRASVFLEYQRKQLFY
jgi:RNAse (barnase) inhibitor barstar